MQDEKKREDEKKEKTEDGEEDKQFNVYSGSDIESIVNSAAEIAWRERIPLSQELLERQRDFIKPLGIVLKDKIARNKEKFGQYNLRPAGFSKKDIQMFVNGLVSKDAGVRAKIAADERCPLNILEKLAKDDDARVRLAALENPNRPASIILQMQDDKDPDVLTKARSLFDSTPEGREKLRKAQAETALKGSEAEKIRLCESASLGDNAQLILARDPSLEARKALANYKFLTIPAMELLVSGGDESIREIIMNRDDRPKDLGNRRCENCRFRSTIGTWCTHEKKPCGQIVSGTKPYCEHWEKRDV